LNIRVIDFDTLFASATIHTKAQRFKAKNS